MSPVSRPTSWPRRVALVHAALVLASWILALALPSAGPIENLPIIVALPWSLLFLDGGPFFGLFALFVAGLLNSGLLYIALGGWRRVAQLPKRRLLLPPGSSVS